MGVGDRVKKIIQRRGLLQEELGRKIGLDKSGMSKLLNNKRKVEEALLLNLTEALGVSSDYLLGIETKNELHNEETKEEREFNEMYRGLNEKQREKLKKMMEIVSDE